MNEFRQPEFENVLLIDDNEIDNFIAGSIVSRAGIAKNIISKNSAEDSLVYLSSCVKNNLPLPQIILLDIRMPSMDGFDFLREFSKLPAAVHSACHIFILSSSVDTRDIERAKKDHHVLGFITKPLTFDNLEKALSMLRFQKGTSYSKSA